MWLGSTQRSRAGVAWTTYCLSKEKGDLNHLDPSEVVSIFMVKWLVTACKPGVSNFKSMLHYCLLSFQPHPKGRWAPSPMWFQQLDHKGSNASKVWHRVTKSWKIMSPFLKVSRPSLFEEWLSTNFWWGVNQHTIGLGLSKE
jgi:hypothetical protein